MTSNFPLLPLSFLFLPSLFLPSFSNLLFPLLDTLLVSTIHPWRCPWPIQHRWPRLGTITTNKIVPERNTECSWRTPRGWRMVFLSSKKSSTFQRWWWWWRKGQSFQFTFCRRRRSVTYLFSLSLSVTSLSIPLVFSLSLCIPISSFFSFTSWKKKNTSLSIFMSFELFIHPSFLLLFHLLLFLLLLFDV